MRPPDPNSHDGQLRARILDLLQRGPQRTVDISHAFDEHGSRVGRALKYLAKQGSVEGVVIRDSLLRDVTWWKVKG